MELSGFGFGKVTFNSSVADKERSAVSEGMVTLVHEAVAGIPAHFTVDFSIWARHQVHGVDVSQLVNLTAVVPAAIGEPYERIEQQGAQSLAAILRQIADLMEAELQRDGE